MIRKLAISNFYSIKEPLEIDFVIAGNAPKIPGRFAEPIKDSNDYIPKVIAIFGPNASGKTTVLRAVSFLKWFVELSFNLRIGEAPPFSPFLSRQGFSGATKLSVELDGQIYKEEKRCVYRYELEFKNSPGKPSEVIFERLAYTTNRRFRRIFERNRADLKFGDFFEIKKNDPRRETIRPNASLISTFAQFNHPMSTWILQGLSFLWTNVVVGKWSMSDDAAADYYYKNPDALEQLNRKISVIDLGIEKVEIYTKEEKPLASFTHSGLDSRLPIILESLGTQSFFKLFIYLHFVLENGGVAFLDELDSDIHPLLLPEIVRWFYDKDTNKHNAQLIMSCHNATLLEELEKEEVFFTEKNNKGETGLYGLKDIDNVRRDTNIYKKYMGGAFGAVPNIG